MFLFSLGDAIVHDCRSKKEPDKKQRNTIFLLLLAVSPCTWNTEVVRNIHYACETHTVTNVYINYNFVYQFAARGFLLFCIFCLFHLFKTSGSILIFNCQYCRSFTENNNCFNHIRKTIFCWLGHLLFKCKMLEWIWM